MSALAISESRVATGGASEGGATTGRPHLYLVPNSAGAPALRSRDRAVVGTPGVRDSGSQLTERGLLAVLVVFSVLALASVAVIVASFFAVSNAPVDAPSGTPVAAGAQR
ncbi:MAG TPA: hypothetical protein VFN73_13200 [Propionibacteriaceae bacterium]|nr:hypothetical protein [Propionibacteriaceae bacterium]